MLEPEVSGKAVRKETNVKWKKQDAAGSCEAELEPRKVEWNFCQSVATCKPPTLMM